MPELVRIGVAGVLGADENGNLGGKQMPTNKAVEKITPEYARKLAAEAAARNVKGLTVPLITQELNEIINRATAQKRMFTPAETKRFEELEWERVNKEAIANEAKIAEARKAGQVMRREDNQKRADARNVHHKVVSRSNSGDRVDRSDAIKARHQKLKAGR